MQSPIAPCCESGQRLAQTDIEADAEFSEWLWEADCDSPLADSTAAASMVRFLFVQGQPGPTGFLLKGISVREVFVAGDFNGWNPTSLPMEQYGDGYWEADIPLPPGQHQYLFVTDGVWRPDPLAEFVPNPFGGVNSVISAPVPRAGTNVPFPRENQQQTDQQQTNLWAL